MPQSWSGGDAEEKLYWPSRKSNRGHSSRSLVAVLAELYPTAEEVLVTEAELASETVCASFN